MIFKKYLPLVILDKLIKLHHFQGEIRIKVELITNKEIIAVTMATGRQGYGVITELDKTNKYTIRAIARDPNSPKSLALSKLANVEIIKGDLLNSESLLNCFENAYGIFGNTTPTKGNIPLVRSYEIDQGRTLINAVKDINKKGDLKHFVFSSVCKAKDPLKNEPAPGHFTSKWDIENYLINNGLREITTILRPASYFENFDGDLPGLKITDRRFPGVVEGNKVWQTIAVKDVGKWTKAAFNNPKRFLGQSFNLAGEEMTGNEMARLLEKIKGPNTNKISYSMVPRLLMKLFVHDIGVMADWIERAQYGADLNQLRLIAKEENITITSLESWLNEKIKGT